MDPFEVLWIHMAPDAKIVAKKKTVTNTQLRIHYAIDVWSTIVYGNAIELWS